MQRIALGLLMAAFAGQALAADKLIVISPHRKSIQDEFVPAFKEFYKTAYKTDVDVEWLDQGGTSDDVRFVRAKFEKTPATSGIDVFWGGGTSTFLDLGNDKALAPFELGAALKNEIPETAVGIQFYDKTQTWYASALSSFGIFFNKKVLKLEGLKEPQTWEDLADAKFKGQLSLTDPRKSGSANTMNNIVLQTLGWEKGWQLLAALAGNTRQFTQSSSDPVKAVVSGDASASMVIDFYATPKIDEIGKDNLGFNLPSGKTIIDPDPIGILKGAPNRQTAERFVAWTLSADAQQLLILAKGKPGGPKIATLGRMAANPKAYDQTEGKRITEANPFKGASYFKMDLAKAAKMQRIFNDLIGATQVDVHTELKAAWEGVIKRGSKPADVAEFAKQPVSEDELLKLADKWDDDVLRNKTINAWVEFAKAKFKKLADAKA